MSTHVQYQTQFKFNSIHSVRIIEICEVPHSLQFWLLCFYVPIFANFFTLINCQGCGFFSMKSCIWIDKNDIDTRFLLLFLLRPKQELIVNNSSIYIAHMGWVTLCKSCLLFSKEKIRRILTQDQSMPVDEQFYQKLFRRACFELFWNV